MVDSLLSDEDLLLRYKNLKDGKRIDHLFGAPDAFRGNRIIYIGDSKYYKDPTQIATQKFKQFTYARNIIQENIYITNEGSEDAYSRNYRDPMSEGYNITPNFFVYATVSSNDSRSGLLLEPDTRPPEFSWHFSNRLFDRDTLHVLYFRIDFLGLLQFYTSTLRRFTASFEKLRGTSRSLIQSELQRYLACTYDFYQAELSDPFIIEHFKALHGKIFTSPAIHPYYILALEKAYTDENAAILSLFSERQIAYHTLQITDAVAHM